MKSTFELELPKTDYCLGDPVRGKLHLDIPSDRKVHGIHIQFYGREWCEYSIWHDIPFKVKKNNANKLLTFITEEVDC